MQGLGKELFEKELFPLRKEEGELHAQEGFDLTSHLAWQAVSEYTALHYYYISLSMHTILSPTPQKIYTGTHRSSASGPCWGYVVPQGLTKICGKMGFRLFPADLGSKEDENWSAGGPVVVILKLESSPDNSTISTRTLRGLNNFTVACNSMNQ